ncbi:MAG: TonB-dependent receptor [Bacteroidia bacterium]|nr:TonB-dependent receptor [Bacteroidia bacterium]
MIYVLKTLRWSLLAGFFSLMTLTAVAQSLSGTIRGRVHDRFSRQPLHQVTVSVMRDGSLVETLTDEAGAFRLENLPVGRHDLTFKATGLEMVVQTDVPVSSSRETVLEVWMEENYYDVEEVTVYPNRNKGTPINEMSDVSALSFEVEETRKFAGGLDDPTRMAANFPGIVGSPFSSENLISIRGNSPRGMVYRLEGIDIPNPNHFARIGSSGGTFTLLSGQTLANSDFFIGAFPAEYGNATSGVFDLRLRAGNNEQREFSFQAGVLGVELAAEGPLSDKHTGSYLVNYRYATLNFANLLISYATVPTYQDISFKINLPTAKAGTFSFFGMGGVSNRPKPAELDSTQWVEDLDRFDNVLGSDMGAVGLSHTYLTRQGAVIKSAVVGSYNFQRDNKNYLEDDLTFRVRDINEYSRKAVAATSSIKHNFSPRSLFKAGIIYTLAWHDFYSVNYDYVAARQVTQVDEAGATQTLQGYMQMRYRLTDRISAQAGLHVLYFDLNDRSSVEPRAGLTWQLDPRQSLSLGYGLHSRIEDYGTYMTRIEGAGNYDLPNQRLDFLKAHHFVLSYQAMLNDHLKFRSEVYLQQMSGVPVTSTGTYSVLNLDELDQLRILVNAGTGRNYGLDMGLERFSRRGLYYMLNLSLFNSTYTDIAGVRHSTAFNNGYKSNLVMGKEFRIGRKRGGNSLMGLNTTLSVIGGQPYTPLDLTASRLARETVLDETQPYTLSETPLFVQDLTWTLTRHKPLSTRTWAIQIKNIYQSAPALIREYDALLDQEVTLRGAGILPLMSYKIDF